MNFYEQLFCRGRTTGEGMTHFERLFAAKFGGSPPPEVREYTGAVPVTITADGTPLLDYRISGNTFQNGTPTPDNPIMPEGTGERTENLLNANRLPSDTWTIDDKYYIDGAVGDSKSSILPDTVDVSISNSGDLTVTARSYYGAGFVIPVTPNTTYTISWTTDTAVPSSKSMATITYVNADEDFLNYITIYGGTTSVTFTTPNTAYYILITFRYAFNTITYSDIMLSSTSLSYEPYGYKIPISSNSTTTPIYLGEVETTRKIKKWVLDGTETITEESTNVYSIPIADTVTAEAGLSTHFEYDSTVSAGQFRIEAEKAVFGYNDTLANFSTFLAAQYAAGTPVTVWYVLATEETAVVNEPLMRIGDYADTVSMEQAGVSIPTNNGSTTVDVDTTVKPSEVYIKYMG